MNIADIDNTDTNMEEHCGCIGITIAICWDDIKDTFVEIQIGRYLMIVEAQKLQRNWQNEKYKL